MPPTAVYIYRESTGECPFLEWLKELSERDTLAVDACLARIELLAQMGHELRRPYTDLLRDGIYELRSRLGRLNYRVLYFYHGRNIAIVTHGLTKEQAVPPAEIRQGPRTKATL